MDTYLVSKASHSITIKTKIIYSKFTDMFFFNDVYFQFTELLKNVSKGLNARLQLGNTSAKEQHALQKIHLQSLQNLKMECKTVIISLFLKCDLWMKLSHINIDLIFCF